MFVIMYNDRGTLRVYGSYKTETAARKEAKGAIHRYSDLTIGKIVPIADGKVEVKWTDHKP